MKELSTSFKRNQPMIEVYALTETNKMGLPIEYATIAIQQIGSNMKSALSLGNIDALGKEMDWLKGLLHEHNQNGESLKSFLAAYAKSVDAAKGNDGQPISNWLKAQINGN